MNPTKTLLASLLGIALGGIPAAHASIVITNGDFQTGAPAANQADVVGWFDSGLTAAWWTGTWYGPTVSPFATNKSCLGLSYMNGTSHWAYQSIGTNSGAINTLKLRFDAGSFTDAGGLRNLGIKVDVYQSDGSFAGGDDVDIATAAGVTLIDSFSVATGDLSAGQVVTGLTGSLNLATANATGELFLRISNYAAGTGEPWAGVDNLVIVYDVPVFSTQPTDLTGNVGGTVTLTAAAASDPDPTFQWEYSPDGLAPWTPVGGATQASLVIAPVALADEGYYRVIATNTNSSATSDVAHLDMAYPNPVIYQQPASTAAEAGTTVTFTVIAGGLGNVTYQWYKDGEPVDGATSDILTLGDVQTSGNGEYTVRITDDAALSEGQPATTILSNPAVLTVFAPWSGLVSHEPFSIAEGYAAGELPTQNPAIGGYTGAWTDIDFGDAEPAVSAGSLAYGNATYLGSSGDKVTVQTNFTGGDITPANSGRVYRVLDSPLVVSDSTSGVRYLSFLFQSGQETGATIYQTLALYKSDTADASRNFDIGLTDNGGQTGTAYDFGIDNAYSSTGVNADAGVHLIVVKFDLSTTAFNDSVTVWVDPTLGAGEPTGGTTVSSVDLNWDRLVLSDYDGNSAAWDEIRWGSTFNSVTLNTSPANTYSSWIGGYPGVGTLAGFNDDADGDGIKNGLENFFGTNPATSGPGIIQVTRSGDTVTFQHPQNASPASDVTAAYVWSSDLATFHANGESSGGATVSFTASPNTPVAGTTTVTATIGGTVPAKLFVALKAVHTTP